MSLEQGLGLTRKYSEDVRAVGPETSVALRRIIIFIIKINPSSPGFDSAVLVPR